jgi:hypothetical protein
MFGRKTEPDGFPRQSSSMRNDPKEKVLDWQLQMGIPSCALMGLFKTELDFWCEWCTNVMALQTKANYEVNEINILAVVPNLKIEVICKDMAGLCILPRNIHHLFLSVLRIGYV